MAEGQRITMGVRNLRHALSSHRVDLGTMMLLPFELLGLADWLVTRCGLAEQAALQTLAAACDLPLPADRALLRSRGLGAPALVKEVQRAAEMGITPLLFGIELVELPGVAELQESQISADLSALRAANPNGLALSWDLHFITDERLRLVRDRWLGA